MASWYDPLGIEDAFNPKDPSKDAMKYFNKIPETVTPYLQPYINAGMGQLPTLEQQYSNLINNPGGTLNKIGEGYNQSPGYQFALDQALQAGNQSAAAGGMAGSPSHEQHNMETATNLANQDYYNYLNHALGLYDTGLHGSQGLYNTGYGASTNLADILANNLASQGNLAYAGGANQNAAKSGLWGSLLGAGSQIGTAALLA